MRHQLEDPYLLYNRLGREIYIRSLKKRVLISHVISAGTLVMTIEIVLKKPI